MTKRHKDFSDQEEVAILKKHLAERIPVSDLCDQFDLHLTLFYPQQ